jgi:aspartate-semialdehyde dehydrogenase
MTNPYKGKVKADEHAKILEETKKILLEKCMADAHTHYMKAAHCSSAEAVEVVKKLEQDHFATTRDPLHHLR